MKSYRFERRFTAKSLAKKTVASAASLAMVAALCPVVPLAIADEYPTVTGGDTITEDGTYQIDLDATGVINIDEGLEVTLVGWGSDVKYSSLGIEAADGVELTIQDYYADQPKTGTETATSAIDFDGNGTLNIEGTNLIDNDGGLNAAVIHVAPEYRLELGGSGTLYGYKSALCSYIGGDANEANGAITFESGNWFIKGTKTGAVIGGDSTTEKGGTITINGGEIYIKGVARGALIGGSAQGVSSDVVINGGLVELFEDFSGPAIGAGSDANAGEVTVNGGSLKTTLSSNSYNSYGSAATYNGMPSANWAAVKATNASNYQLMTFDASDYVGETIDVDIDGVNFYDGSTYSYVTNEAKNPNDITGTTMDNWLENDESWLVTEEDYTNAYPEKNGSSFVPENNLYFALTKTDHTMTVNGTEYAITYDEKTDSFSYEVPAPITEIASADDFVEFASAVNGGESYEGLTVTLSADIDLSGVELSPVGGAESAFDGVFDGDGHSISGVEISTTEGYAALFGATGPEACIEDLSVYGSVTTTTTGDFAAGLVAYNMGIVTDVSCDVDVTAEGAYNVGGIAGFNDGGYNANVSTTVATGGAAQVLNSSYSGEVRGNSKVGGIAGENSGSIYACYVDGTVYGANSSSKNGVGGIAGRNGNNNTALEEGLIDSCYVVGTVGSQSGQKWVGGIAGFNNALSSIKNSYMAGDLAAGTNTHNGIAGNNEGASLTSNNYSLDSYTVSGKTEAETGILLSSDEMKADATVIALGEAYNADTDGINYGYPVLTWQGGTAAMAVSVETELTAVGSETAFSAEVYGADAETTSFQWQYRKSETGKWINSSLECATTAELMYKCIEKNTGYQFRCVATAEDGRVAMSEPVGFELAEVTATVTSLVEDYSATVECTTNFTDEGATYQWQYQKVEGGKWINSKALADTGAEGTYVYNAGGTTAKIASYAFRCVVTTSDGKVFYSDATYMQQ